MLIYDQNDKKMNHIMEQFRFNGGDVLIDDLCVKEDYAVSLFRADKAYKKKWIVDLNPSNKIIRLNGDNRTKERDYVLGLAKALSHEIAHRDNQTDGYDPKFKERHRKDYEAKMIRFGARSRLNRFQPSELLETPMVNGLVLFKRNMRPLKGNTKSLKKLRESRLSEVQESLTP